MATTTIGTGETYTTIQGWEDNVLSGVLTEQETGQCKAESFSNVMFSGSTTTSSYYIKLTSVSGAEHDGRAHEVSGAGNARIEWSAAVNAISIQDEFVEVSWLEISGPGNYQAHGIGVLPLVATSWFRFHHNVIHNNRANAAGSRGIYVNDVDGTFRIYRNIVYGWGIDGINFDDGSTDSRIYYNTVLFNNTVASGGRGGIFVEVDRGGIEGNASFDNDNKDFVNTNGTLDYNADSDGSETEGVNTLNNLTSSNELVNPTTTWANTDLTIKSGANLIGEGNDPLSGTYTDFPEINYPITSRTTAITGTWDIGADQYVAAGTNIEVPASGPSFTSYAPTVDITNHKNITVPNSTPSFSSLVPTIFASDHQEVEVPATNPQFTSQVPVASISADKDIEVPSTNPQFTSQIPVIGISDHQNIEVPASTPSFSSLVPVVFAGNNIEVEIPFASLAFNSLIPGIGVTAHKDIEVPVASLLLSSLVPILEISGALNIDVPVASLLLSSLVPGLSISDHKNIEIPVASLLLSSFAPSAFATNPQNIDVPVASLLLSSLIPGIEITNDVLVRVPVASLLLSSYAPLIIGSEDVLIEVPVASLLFQSYAPLIIVPASWLLRQEFIEDVSFVDRYEDVLRINYEDVPYVDHYEDVPED